MTARTLPASGDASGGGSAMRRVVFAVIDGEVDRRDRIGLTHSLR